MFGIFRKKKNKLETKKIDEAEYVDDGQLVKPAWFEVGKENPFNGKILDIRCVTLNIIATTGERSIAENYNSSRHDYGEKYIGQEIQFGKKFVSSLKYPHNGDKLKGIVYKSRSMDEKWDIYAYGEWLYFVRSWTSELIYKVHYVNSGSELVLDYIITALDEGETTNLHEQNIHSTILTHVLGKVWPYTIPKELLCDDEKKIALHLFSQFGCKATIATPENVVKIDFVNKNENNN